MCGYGKIIWNPSINFSREQSYTFAQKYEIIRIRKVDSLKLCLVTPYDFLLGYSSYG